MLTFQAYRFIASNGNRLRLRCPRQSYTSYKLFSSDVSGLFTDRVAIRVTGGRGGDGCLSFARGPNQEIAPPDGGNGGDGGSVWIQADIESRSLRQSTTLVRGRPGRKGQSAKRRGHNGADVVLKVPCGTVVTELVAPTIVEASERTGDEKGDGEKLSTDNALKQLGEIQEREGASVFNLGSEKDDLSTTDLDRIIAQLKWEVHLEERGLDPSTVRPPASTAPAHGDAMGAVKQKVCELNKDGQRVLVAEGGRGGRGNLAFKHSTNRSPMRMEEGAAGQDRRLELELKTIADVGLVGFPNAGKSTLLRAVSRAKPKVAAYPFTTLRPHIGMVYPTMGQSVISVADIPGLIEGAHEDKGLGHDFLRHIERTAFLVYVIDSAQGAAKACRNLAVLREELDLYLPGLASRASCVVANKMDISSENARSALAALIDYVGDTSRVFPVSAKYGVGVDDVVQHLGASLQAAGRRQAREEETESNHDVKTV